MCEKKTYGTSFTVSSSYNSLKGDFMMWTKNGVKSDEISNLLTLISIIDLTMIDIVDSALQSLS